MSQLPTPPTPDSGGVVDWVSEHLGDLALEGRSGIRSGGIGGGQAAADLALAELDVTGYSARRSAVLPREARGASRMSPYIRHGLLTLTQVWDAVAGAPSRDRARYRDELLWQEYARHLYARVGGGLRRSLRHEPPPPTGWPGDPWPTEMACMDLVIGELHQDGWLVNQTRMWLASQWAVRAGAAWTDGEQEMFAHLLDGSRAANGLGWQWTIGTGSGKPYGFSRWQVEKRAPGLCASCALREACPIQQWPDVAAGRALGDTALGPAPDSRVGPDQPVRTADPDVVWLTAESVGRLDPALAAHPDLPAVFVFDEPLLRRIRLSGKRLVFLAETLGDLASHRPLEVRRGGVAAELSGRRPAVTFAPVPGFGTRAGRIEVAELHPWPWLVRPAGGSVRSYSAWRRDLSIGRT